MRTRNRSEKENKRNLIVLLELDFTKNGSRYNKFPLWEKQRFYFTFLMKLEKFKKIWTNSDAEYITTT